MTRFTIETVARPANTVDWIAINLAGRWFQDLNWKTVAGKIAELGGGSVPDGGTTVMLLGAALGALGMVRRYLKS